MIVVDASVLAPALGDDGTDGRRARSLLNRESLVAPELIDLEVASVLRRQLQRGRLPIRRAEAALDDLAVLPLRRVAHRALLDRCWELRDNLTTYDAAYAAVAETFDVALVTADERLAHAPGLRCHVQLIGSSSTT